MALDPFIEVLEGQEEADRPETEAEDTTQNRAASQRENVATLV